MNREQLGRSLVFLCLLSGWTPSLWAQEEGGQAWSGKIGIGSGIFQPAQDTFHPFLYSHLELGTQPEITEGLCLDLEGQANWQTAGVPMPSFEPEAPRKNLIDLQYESAGYDDPQEVFQLELDQAALWWASGPLELRAGLFKPDWGHSAFYRPTDYFFPVPPLSWLRDEPSASQGADATCFLFDDLSVEGATRFLEGGDHEWVTRVIQRGIGLTIIPSFARLGGRDGLGWEVMGTLPTVQLRFEGVEWQFVDGHNALDWNLGASTLSQGLKYTAEVLRDGTGEILGDDLQDGPGTYIYISVEGDVAPGWKVDPVVVVPLEGGPLLFWPKVTWAFAPQWESGFQAQILLGDGSGPLRASPGRAGLSLDYLL